MHNSFFWPYPLWINYITKMLLLSSSSAVNSKHLMTGPKGNSKLCIPETFNVSCREAEGNIEVEGKQNSLFPVGPVIY